MSDTSNSISNIDISRLLYAIEELIRERVSNTIVWDEKSNSMKGKYFYLNVNDIQIGVFLGFIIKADRVDRCIVLCFTDPKARVDMSIAVRTEQLFKDLQKRLEGFRFIKDDLPALMKISALVDESNAIEFFRDSLSLLLNTWSSTSPN